MPSRSLLHPPAVVGVGGVPVLYAHQEPGEEGSEVRAEQYALAQQYTIGQQYAVGQQYAKRAAIQG